MTEHEKFLLRLDIRKIDDNGRYIDLEHVLITQLTYEDILFLRTQYPNHNIAKNFEFKSIKALDEARLKTPGQSQKKKAKSGTRVRVENTEPARRPAASTSEKRPTNQRPSQPRPAAQSGAAKRPTPRKHYALTKEDKYTGQHHKGISFPYKRLAAGALVLCMAITFIHSFAKNDVTTLPADPGYGIVATNPHDVAGSEDIITTTKPTTPEASPEQEMRDICEEAARIYQLDANALYEVIMSNTDGLTSDDYLENYTFEGVSYKGSGQVDCTSPEQMAIIAARAMDQDAQRFGLNRKDIKDYSTEETQKNYDSYVQMIGYYCDILGEDPCLIYGIMKAETGWDSRLLNDLNNPAGLKLNNGNWWEFETIESGIIELILQVHSYRWSGANTVEEMAAIHCPIDDPDDVNKVNQYWVGNVKDGMAEARSIYANMNLSNGTNRL